MTPLYKHLKDNGSTLYVFPGAAEDQATFQANPNYKVNFSKFALLNIPSQKTSGDNKRMDFYNTFNRLSTAEESDFAEQFVESLRNYVANHEEVIRISKSNNVDYWYDHSELLTVSERIFWKWCRKVNILSLDPATVNDDYIYDENEFAPKNNNSDYYPEILWKERNTQLWDITSIEDGGTLVVGSNTYLNAMKVTYSADTNFRVNDWVEFSNIEDATVGTQLNSNIFKVVKVEDDGSIVWFDEVYTESTLSGDGQAKLDYTRLVQWIGEITTENVVEDENRKYRDVYAQIPDFAGQTRTILFRTQEDNNYKPNLEFPILTSEYQAEIIGAESFSNPIASNPSNYPGDKYGHFDTTSWTYELSDGDSLRRTGDFYGVYGTDRNSANTTLDPSDIDGLLIDFEPNHYAGMNLSGQEVDTFIQYSGLSIDNEAPSNFDFNAILWYYQVQDSDGNIRENLYGIQLLDNPANNDDTALVDIEFPTYKKIATGENQNGVSFGYTLRTNYYVQNDDVVPEYNPNKIYDLQNFELFGEAMKQLILINQSFLTVLGDNNELKNQIAALEQRILSWGNINEINRQIDNLNKLLTLYQSMQIVNSATVTVSVDESGDYPLLSLDAQASGLDNVQKFQTLNMYDNERIETLISVFNKEDFAVIIENNDTQNQNLTDENLMIYFDRDLYYGQSATITITPNETSWNKKIDIELSFTSNDSTPANINLWTVDLPTDRRLDDTVSHNSLWDKGTTINVDWTKSTPISYSNNILTIYLETLSNVKEGDWYFLNNFVINDVNWSGFYENVSTTEDVLELNIPNDFATTLDGLTGTIKANLDSRPYISPFKGWKLTVTRISEADTTSFEERYLLNKEML